LNFHEFCYNKRLGGVTSWRGHLGNSEKYLNQVPLVSSLTSMPLGSFRLKDYALDFVLKFMLIYCKVSR